MQNFIFNCIYFINDFRLFNNYNNDINNNNSDDNNNNNCDNNDNNINNDNNDDNINNSDNVNNNNIVKFDVFESDSIFFYSPQDDFFETRSDGDELKIYKNYNEITSDLANKGYIVNDDLLSKICGVDVFDNKSVILYYNYDYCMGLKYTFQSINIIDNELFLNVEINTEGDHGFALDKRLFIIEVNKNDVNAFDKIKCKIKIIK